LVIRINIALTHPCRSMFMCNSLQPLQGGDKHLHFCILIDDTYARSRYTLHGCSSFFAGPSPPGRGLGWVNFHRASYLSKTNSTANRSFQTQQDLQDRTPQYQYVRIVLRAGSGRLYFLQCTSLVHKLHMY